MTDFKHLYPSVLKSIGNDLKDKTHDEKLTYMRETFHFLHVNDEVLVSLADKFVKIFHLPADETKISETKQLEHISQQIELPFSHNNILEYSSTYKCPQWLPTMDISSTISLEGPPGVKRNDFIKSIAENIKNTIYSDEDSLFVVPIIDKETPGNTKTGNINCTVDRNIIRDWDDMEKFWSLNCYNEMRMSSDGQIYLVRRNQKG